MSSPQSSFNVRISSKANMVMLSVHLDFPVKDHILLLHSEVSSMRKYKGKVLCGGNGSIRFSLFRKKLLFRVKASSSPDKEQLKLLDCYFGKLGSDNENVPISKNGSGESPAGQNNDRTDDRYDNASDFYFVSMMVSINIGVCLFEAAAPVTDHGWGLASLPRLYGSKINDLIIAGEWWRLLTPMFLHSGVPHIALTCWALLTFGPKVCRGYGRFAFFLIYILGGISGNFSSFLHTPDPTVGGTGPAFGVIGAWLVYQKHNREMMKEDVTEDLFQKAMVMIGLGLILSHFGPTDDWTNMGSILAGITYGYLICPAPQLGDSDSRSEQGEERIAAYLKQIADPQKSFLVFIVFLAVLVSSIALFIDSHASSL